MDTLTAICGVLGGCLILFLLGMDLRKMKRRFSEWSLKLPTSHAVLVDDFPVGRIDFEVRSRQKFLAQEFDTIWARAEPSFSGHNKVLTNLDMCGILPNGEIWLYKPVVTRDEFQAVKDVRLDGNTLVARLGLRMWRIFFAYSLGLLSAWFFISFAF